MTVSNTPRFGLKKYSSGGDPHPTRVEFNEMVDLVENNSSMFSQGITAARPAAGKIGREYWDTEAGRKYYDDGVNWKDLNPNGGGGAPAKVTPGVDGVEGVSARAARADHKHRLDLATSAAAGAMSGADKALLDTATAAATGNALARRDAGGRISVNTPTDAAHAATMAYVDGTLVQSADYTDAKLTAGVAPQILAPLAVTGYSLVGRITVERKGAYNEVKVDINVTRTGGTGDIPTSFASFGSVIPSGARGDSLTDKYLPIVLSGGSNNGSATLFVDTDTGEFRIRAHAAFTITNGATFTANFTYTVPAA